jgi:sugar lactone lactonase YvrE
MTIPRTADNYPLLARLTHPLLHSPSFHLPESPVHDPKTGLTYFTDIPQKCIYSFDVRVGQDSLRRIDVGEHVGCVFLIDGVSSHFLLFFISFFFVLFCGEV